MATHVLDARTPDGDAHRSASGWPAAAPRRCSPCWPGCRWRWSPAGATPVRGRERAAARRPRAAGRAADRGDRAAAGRAGVRAGGDPDLLRGAVRARPAVPRPGGARCWAWPPRGPCVAPVLSPALRPDLPPRGFESPTCDQLAEPGQLLTELLLTGYYPAVPWLAYLLLGLGVGRLDLRRPVAAPGWPSSGAVLAVAATVVSRVLARRRGRGPLLADPPDPDGATALLDRTRAGCTAPTPHGRAPGPGCSSSPRTAPPRSTSRRPSAARCWCWACACWSPRRCPVGGGRRRVCFGAGTMTLTLYSLHVVLRTPAVWPPDGSDTFLCHVLVVLGVGAVFVARGWRGPLEALVGGPPTAPARWSGCWPARCPEARADRPAQGVLMRCWCRSPGCSSPASCRPTWRSGPSRSRPVVFLSRWPGSARRCR